MIQMMLRPRWVLMLLLALAIAGAFALLGQWQLNQAIVSGVVVERATETVLPINDVVEPDGAARQVAIGQMVTVTGAYVPGDEQLVEGRLNDGELGFWVVSRFVQSATEMDAAADSAIDPAVDAAGANIAVARGWVADEAGARTTMASFAAQPANAPVTLTARFLPSEAPVVPEEDADPRSMTTLSPATLINLWTDFTDQPVYAGYLVDSTPPAGLDQIDSPIPLEEVPLNWLNIFYAIEWVVFGGFAIFLWFRLVRDAVEREAEEADLLAAEAASATPAAP